MKLDFLNARLVNIVISVFLVLVIGGALLFLAGSGSESISIGTSNVSSSKVISSEMRKTFDPIDTMPTDQLSNKEYSRLADSIKNIRMLKNGTVRWSVGTLFIGAATFERCEDCTFKSINKPMIKEHFIVLNWWKLDTVSKGFPINYYVKDGQSYLRRTVCRSENPSNKDNGNYICDEVNTAVPFRYDTKLKHILIPVSEQTVKVLGIVFCCFTFLAVLYFFYIIIGGFIKVLIEIAQGTPFSKKNVSRLKWIALSLSLIPLAVFLLNLLMPLVFYKYFTVDVKLNVLAWDTFWKPAVLGVIFAALYLAFKQGKKLKDEQDLTV